MLIKSIFEGAFPSNYVVFILADGTETNPTCVLVWQGTVQGILHFLSTFLYCTKNNSLRQYLTQNN